MKTRAVTYIMEIYTSNNTMTSAHCDYDVLGRRIEARSFADSPAAMLTEYGVVERYEYDAYGRRSVMTPGFAHRNNSHYLSDIGLTGREIDELDLDATATPRLQHMHYRHRDYSPQLGRFLQHDPLMHVDGMNFYQYVKSKPISQLDPLGLKTLRGKVELAPGKLMSFGYEYVYEYDDSCGDDGKTPSFTGKGVTYSNSLWQADTVAIGIIGGKFNVLVEISVTSGDCPPEQEGGVLNVDLTFKPVYQDGIVIGIGPIGVPIWTPKPRPAGFPEDNQRLQVVCCKKECD